MAENGKGKGKAPMPMSYDSDSDDDFFITKRQPVFRNNSPPKSPSPPVRTHSDFEADGSPNSHKKKRKPVSKKPTLDLPAWTRHGSNEHKKGISSGRSRKGSSQVRGSTEERAETIVIDDSGDEAGPSSRSSKKVTRRRVQLTPPPEMSEQSKAEIAKIVREHLGDKFANGSEQVEDKTASSPEKDDENIETVRVTIRMVAPPEKIQSAAPAAIKEYQKGRTLILSRVGPMSKGIASLSDRLQKRPEDIILVYNDNRVYPRSTPAQLGILDKADMSGYEKFYWDRLEAERRRALEALSDDDDDLPPQNGNADNDDIVPLNSLHPIQPNNGVSHQPMASSSGPSTRSNTQLFQNQNQNQYTTEDPQSQSQSQSQNQNQDLIHFKISSSLGEERMKGPKTLKLSAILRFYCKKIGKSQTEAEKMYIKFDGEKLDKNLKIGETEVEDGDMLEVGF